MVMEKGGMRVLSGGEDALLDKNRKMRRRAAVMLALFVLAAAGLVVRLVWLQLIQGEEYARMAYVGQTRQQQIRPKRGSIYDRNGKGLAISAEVDTVSANPPMLRQETEDRPELIPQMADKLSSLLGLERDAVYAKLTATDSFVFIARKIDKEIGTSVREYLQSIKIGSVYVDADSKRFYPKGSLASHIIGFTGTDDQGLLGMELELDGLLKGQPGRILSEVDAKGNSVRFDESLRLEAQDGYDVTLTIDETIQDMTEEALAGIIKEWNVRNGAAAIVIDPNTGEVLAMASLPDFDPNKPDAEPAGWSQDAANAGWEGFLNEDQTGYLWQHVFRNKAVMDTYEPGSTFKPITAAAALETGVVTPDTIVHDVPYDIGGWQINCWKAGGHGQETFREAVYNSCNPVFSQVSSQMGLDRFYQFARLFGFMERTGIEIAGEPSNDSYRSLWHAVPSETDMAVAAFGQRFQISPIQLITAYTAIANGGALMKPTVIKQVMDAEGRLVERNEPEVVRQVISQQTSETMRDILEGVVSEGTGKRAYVSGYRLAGKTGTSETDKTEAEGRYIVSFASFAPADNPQICLLIEVDWPQAEASSDVAGGRIVAPVAGRLTEQILTYLKVERAYSEADRAQMEKETYVPDVMDLTLEAARTRLASYGFAVKSATVEAAETDVVTRVVPAVGQSVPQGSTVILHTGETQDPVLAEVPDLTGQSVSDARTSLLVHGLNLRVIGAGSAVSQSPAPGSPLEQGEVVDVQFSQGAVH